VEDDDRQDDPMEDALNRRLIPFDWPGWADAVLAGIAVVALLNLMLTFLLVFRG